MWLCLLDMSESKQVGVYHGMKREEAQTFFEPQQLLFQVTCEQSDVAVRPKLRQSSLPLLQGFELSLDLGVYSEGLRYGCWI